MKPSDFLVPVTAEDDPWQVVHTVLNTDLVDRLRQGPQDDIDDLDATVALTQLARDELTAFATGGGGWLIDEGIADALKALRAMLRRHAVQFEPPFRTFEDFRTYWKRQGMGGSYDKRREYLLDLFDPVQSRLDELEREQASPNVRGADGTIKNLIFASTGPKPEIVLTDALENIIVISSGGDSCLIYDRSFTNAGLTWGELVSWWREKARLISASDIDVAHDLYRRLFASLSSDSPGEQLLFKTYCERYGAEGGAAVPALLPQVYLHYDPLAPWQRHNRPSVLLRQRMDFLLLFPQRARVVLEVDGQHHYADGGRPSPRGYAQMMAEDRRLRLRGYELYRFGADELLQPGAAPMLRQFFDGLLERYGSSAH
jgi:hypothetical protein